MFFNNHCENFAKAPAGRKTSVRLNSIPGIVKSPSVYSFLHKRWWTWYYYFPSASFYTWKVKRKYNEPDVRLTIDVVILLIDTALTLYWYISYNACNVNWIELRFHFDNWRIAGEKNDILFFSFFPTHFNVNCGNWISAWSIVRSRWKYTFKGILYVVQLL